MTRDPKYSDPDTPYDGRIDLAVENNSHTIQFELIQEHCGGKPSHVLDVGCSSGYFGEALKAVGHSVWGVEPNPAAAKIAAWRLDHVSPVSVEEYFESHPGPDGRFDYITFGDVLEHLPSPEETLAQAVNRLRPGGAIVASIPNVAHAAVRLMLLEGRWEYNDLGILDRTHRRFFNRVSLLQLFSDAGLHVEMMDCVRLPIELTGIPVDQTLEREAERLFSDDDQDVFQFVLLATRAPQAEARKWNNRYLESRYRRILCLPPLADWTIGDIRLRKPLSWWTRIYGGRVRLKQVHSAEPPDLDWADFVVLQRQSDAFTLALIDSFHEKEKRVILDIDDLLTDVPHFLLTHADAKLAKPTLELTLSKVDGITVTTSRLGEHIRKINECTFVVPNCASNPESRRTWHDEGAPSTNLIVASSDTVRVDFLVPVLRQLIAEHPGKFAIVAIGPPADALQEAGIPVTTHPLMPHREFKNFISRVANGIGLIPLDDSVFSTCKSPIKFLDYALAGIPAICSAVPPYADIVRHEETGLLVENTLEAWRTAILTLALSAERRRTLAGAAERDCRGRYSMSRAAHEWQTAFLKLETLAPRTAPPVSQDMTTAPSRRARITSLARGLLIPPLWGKIIYVVRREGLKGLRLRLRRLGIL